MIAGQPRLAGGDDAGPGCGFDASPGQGLRARRLVSRDDRVGAAPRRCTSSTEQARVQSAASPLAQELKPFFRAGGFWRNFKARYAESDEMYARMLGISRRLAAVSAASEGTIPTTWKSPAASSFAASATAPTGMARSAGSIFRISGTPSIAA